MKSENMFEINNHDCIRFAVLPCFKTCHWLYKVLHDVTYLETLGNATYSVCRLKV